MIAFLKLFKKRGTIGLPSNSYISSCHRTHFTLNRLLKLDDTQLYGSPRTLLSTNRYLAAVTVAVQHDLHTFQKNHYHVMLMSSHSCIPSRSFHLGQGLYEQPSSKVEATVQNMKNKQKEKVEEIIKEAAAGKTGVQKLEEETKKAVAIKKPLKTRIWEECLHYYHGFRLLFIDIRICGKLLWRVLNGRTLTRRENRLLVRTTSDLFRLIPFSVFVVVPFLELALPLFIKFFPGMLPSTFQTTKDREDKLKQALQVRLEVAKFLQKTLDEMTVEHMGHKEGGEAKEFETFIQKIKNPNELISNEEIIKFAKRFEDEITLDSLNGKQLTALCRVLELNTVGTSNMLRFQLRLKLRSLAADDRVIDREGVNSLDLWELQQACKARGMRAYGLTKERMQHQLQEWIDLSLNEKVPSTLLLLSRAVSISDDTVTTDKLKETLRVIPDSLANQTKAAISEREGKIDNKVKLEIMREEVRKIEEEKEEEKQAKSKSKARKRAEMEDVSLESIYRTNVATNENSREERPVLPNILKPSDAVKQIELARAKDAEEKCISSKDVELISEALKTLSTDKKMVLEKETIKDIKTELEDYKEDVEELREVRKVVKEPIQESQAAKKLFQTVNSMIGQLDNIVKDMETKHHLGKTTGEQQEADHPQDDTLQIDDLMETVKKLKQTSKESRLKQIQNILSKLDDDKDGAISVDDVLKVIEALGRENVKLSEKQLEELIILLNKEEVIEAEEKIEKAIAKSIKQADETKKVAEKIQEDEMNSSSCEKQQANASNKCSDDLKDNAKPLKDNALDLDEVDKKNMLKSDGKSESVMFLPKTPTPTLPPTTKPTPGNSKDKMI